MIDYFFFFFLVDNWHLKYLEYIFCILVLSTCMAALRSTCQLIEITTMEISWKDLISFILTSVKKSTQNRSKYTQLPSC